MATKIENAVVLGIAANAADAQREFAKVEKLINSVNAPVNRLQKQMQFLNAEFNTGELELKTYNQAMAKLQGQLDKAEASAKKLRASTANAQQRATRRAANEAWLAEWDKVAATNAEAEASRKQAITDRRALRNSGSSYMAQFDTPRMATQREMRGAYSMYRQGAIDADQYARAIRAIRNEASMTTKALASLKGATAVFGPLAVVEGVRRSILASADMDKAQARFKVFMGSATEAKKAMEELRDLSAKGISFEASREAVATMLQFGVANKEVLPAVKAMAEITAGDTERLKRLSLAYAQVSSAGKLMAEELNQMVEAGFNPLQQISAQTGKSMTQLRAEMKKGEVSFAMVAKSIQDAVGPGGRFNGLLAEIANTSAGQMARAKAEVEAFQVAFGKAIEPATVVALKEASNLTRDLAMALRDLTSIASEAGGVLNGLGNNSLSSGLRGSMATTPFSMTFTGIDSMKAIYQAATSQREELVRTLTRLDERTNGLFTKSLFSSENQARLKEAQKALSEIESIVERIRNGGDVSKIEREYGQRAIDQQDSAKLTPDAQWKADLAKFEQMADKANSDIERQRLYVELIEKSGRGRLGKGELSLAEFDKMAAEIAAIDAQNKKQAETQARISEAFDSTTKKVREQIAELRLGKEAYGAYRAMIDALPEADRPKAMAALDTAPKGSVLEAIGASTKDVDALKSARAEYEKLVALQQQLAREKKEADQKDDEAKKAKKLADEMRAAAKRIKGDTESEFIDQMAKLTAMQKTGMITGDQFTRERDRLAREALGTKHQDLAPALTVGSAEAYKALVQASQAARDMQNRRQEALRLLAEKQVTIAQRSEEHLAAMRGAMADGDEF